LSHVICYCLPSGHKNLCLSHRKCTHPIFQEPYISCMLTDLPRLIRVCILVRLLSAYRSLGLQRLLFILYYLCAFQSKQCNFFNLWDFCTLIFNPLLDKKTHSSITRSLAYLGLSLGLLSLHHQDV
jgi:hypothetical protein